jgi:hypothetical protein
MNVNFIFSYNQLLNLNFNLHVFLNLISHFVQILLLKILVISNLSYSFVHLLFEIQLFLNHFYLFVFSFHVLINSTFMFICFRLCKYHVVVMMSTMTFIFLQQLPILFLKVFDFIVFPLNFLSIPIFKFINILIAIWNHRICQISFAT